MKGRLKIELKTIITFRDQRSKAKLAKKTENVRAERELCILEAKLKKQFKNAGIIFFSFFVVGASGVVVGGLVGEVLVVVRKQE